MTGTDATLRGRKRNLAVNAKADHGMAVAPMELDIEDFSALEDYLRSRRYIGRREAVECHKLAGGISNKTVRVAFPGGTAWVLKQALPKLRVSSDWVQRPAKNSGRSKRATLAQSAGAVRVCLAPSIAGRPKPRTNCVRFLRQRCILKLSVLQPYYIYTADKIPASAIFFNVLVQETRANPLSLVHGDFSPKNTLVYENRLIVLDYEVIHFGDPSL